MAGQVFADHHIPAGHAHEDHSRRFSLPYRRSPQHRLVAALADWAEDLVLAGALHARHTSMVTWGG
jgi:hypothetical protein